ncbi:MAG TPA: lipoate--protein ligase family protein [Burkholderiaceae bacterium]|nr:lipoate--protein ligase family protein [Burkholderiaceae bacterium]
MSSSPLPVTPERVSGEAVPMAGPFTLHQNAPGECVDPRYDEVLIELAAKQGPTAGIWQSGRGLVVPRSYRRFDTFEQSCAAFARKGWPVTVRRTGGGIVPQGPGIVNFSLAYRVEGPPMQYSEAGYRLICARLSAAFADLGIDAFPAAVEGSFCDGRYNLAVLRDGIPVKIAGTAQMWQRIPGTADSHIGLVHALVLLDIDTTHATEAANQFEASLGSDRRYRADRVISASELLPSAPGLYRRFLASLEHNLLQSAEI